MRLTKLAAIVRHEYLTRVRSFGFVVSTLLGPLILILTFAVPPVRILAQKPPAWQILVSLFVDGICVLVLVRFAAGVYRTGMLMYGKRLTAPEIWRWARHR